MATTNLTPAQLQEDRGPQLAGVVIAFGILSLVTVILRCYVRIFMSKSFGYDDGMILFTFMNLVLYAAFVLNGIHYGTGQHSAALKPANYEAAMKNWWFAEIWYTTTSTLLRISVAMLLLRLTTIHWHRVVLYVLAAISTTMGVTLTFTFIYQCQPISFFWSSTRNPSDGHCLDFSAELAFIYAHGAVACLGDWTLGILPWVMVRGLNMQRRMKVTVGLLLCLANFGSIATIVRFYCIKQIATSTDFLFATVDIAIWSALEIGTGIPAACLVTLRPLFRSYFGASSDTHPSYSGPGGAHHAHAPGLGSHGFSSPRAHANNNAASFRGAIGHNNMAMKPLPAVTTTISGAHIDPHHGSAAWLTKKSKSGAMVDDSSSDELPLQHKGGAAAPAQQQHWLITRDQEIDVEYSSGLRQTPTRGL